MKKSILYVLVGILVIGLLTAWIVGAESSKVKEAVLPDTLGEEPPITGADALYSNWAYCTPSIVGVVNDQGTKNRVWVYCAQINTPNIRYFALPQSRSTSAITFETAAVTAKIHGKSLYIRYDTADTSGAVWGCFASDCRTVKEVRIY